MVDELVSAYGSRFFVAALGVLLALGCLVLVLWIMKKRSASLFIRGNRTRLPRLQVLDATAVDSRRRLVLVRRDNIEHLIMIGGPTDLVIESRIGETDSFGADASDPYQQQQIVAAQPRQVTEIAPPAAALPRAERRRQEASAPAAPAPPAPQARQPARQQPTPGYRRDEPVAPAPDEVDQQPNSFFYDEFADDSADEDDLADLLEATRERVFSEPEPAPAVQRAAQTSASEAQAAIRQQRAAPVAATPAQTFSASDFARVLEEEMALQMSAEQQAALTPARASTTPPPTTRPTVAPARPVAPPLPTGRAAEPRRAAPEPIPARPAEERRQAAPTASRPLPQAAARVQQAAATAPRPSPAMARPAPPAPSKSGAQPNLQNEIARIFGEMSTKREK